MVSLLGDTVSRKKQMPHWKISKDEGKAFAISLDACFQIWFPQIADPKTQAVMMLCLTSYAVFGQRYIEQMQIESKMSGEKSIDKDAN